MALNPPAVIFVLPCALPIPMEKEEEDLAITSQVHIGSRSAMELNSLQLVAGNIDFMGAWELQVSVFLKEIYSRDMGHQPCRKPLHTWLLGEAGKLPVGSHCILACWERQESFDPASVFSDEQNATFLQLISQRQE